MKIIVVENNSQSGKNDKNLPYFYLKPDVSIIRNNQPVYYPVLPQKMSFILNFVFKVNRLGKSVQKKFIHRYFNEISIGANFFLDKYPVKNKPGFDDNSRVTLFDNSLYIGKLVEKSLFQDLSDICISLFVNDQKIIDLSTNSFILKPEDIIPFVSKYLTIKMGDYILSSFHTEINDFKPGDRIIAKAENHALLDFYIK